MPLEIKLAEEFTIGDPEYSGLAWVGQNLILLPQYPDRFPGPLGGNILSVPKERIQSYLSGPQDTPLILKKIGFNDDGVSKTVPGFEGFEALVIDEKSIYLTIEAKEGEGRLGYIVSGTVDLVLGEIHLDRSSLKQIRSSSFMFQMSFESLLMWGDLLVAFYEANGQGITESPQAVVFDKELNQLEEIPIPFVEYRITDATSISEEGFFWMINYYYPGEEKLKPKSDPIVQQFGQGTSHAKEETVERLVQFFIKDGNLTFGNRPPIQLTLETDVSRNWEGIVRLDNQGFLIISDTYPRTIFSFVPAKPN